MTNLIAFMAAIVRSKLITNLTAGIRLIESIKNWIFYFPTVTSMDRFLVFKGFVAMDAFIGVV